MAAPGRKVPICGANKSRGRGLCEMDAGQGTDHYGFGRCKFHGGCTEAGKKFAEKEMVRARMTHYGAPMTGVAPGEILIQEIERTAGHVGWLRDYIERAGDVTFDANGTPLPSNAGLVQTVEGKAIPSAILTIYMDERAHLIRACKMALDAGIDERRVRLAENQGALLARVIGAILHDLLGRQSIEEARAAASEVVRGRLLELSSLAPPAPSAINVQPVSVSST